MSSNQLSPTCFVNIWWAIHQLKYSGQLTFKSNAQKRKIRVIDGFPVSYESARTASELESLIKKKQLVPAARLSWVASRIGPDEALVPALVEMGELSPSDVERLEHMAQLDSIGHMLNWKRGTWQFERMPWLEGALSPLLLNNAARESRDGAPKALKVDVVAACWMGVQDLSQNDLFEALAPLMSVTLQWSDASAVEQREDSTSEPLVSSINALLDSWSLAWLSEILQLGTTLSEVGEVAAQQSGEDELRRAFAAIWLFIKLGCFEHIPECKNPTAEELLVFDGKACLTLEPMLTQGTQRSRRRAAPVDEPDAASTQTESREDARERRRKRRKARGQGAQQAGPSATVQERVEAFFSNRFEASFYTFLRQENSATYRQLDQASLRLMKRWKGWLKDGELDDSTRRKLQQLFKGAKLVRETLTDPEKRSEYDKLLLAGAAPSVFQALSEQRRGARASRSERSAAKKEQAPQRDLIGELLESGEFQRALPLLQHARQEEPSNIEVLSRLGWTLWKAETNFRKAEEYLSLALTFDGRNAQALEWYGRILIQSGKRDKALRIATALKRVDANNIWASQLLSLGDG